MKRLFVALLFALTTTTAHARIEWSLDNYVETNSYRNDGAAARTPYPEEGDEAFYEQQLSVEHERGPVTNTLDASMLANSDPFRDDRNGYFPERVLFRRTNSEELPYRFSAGDVYTNVTSRTLQRSLKGASLDLQPSPNSSLLFMGGVQHFDWEDLDEYRSSHSGLSYVHQFDNYSIEVHGLSNYLRNDRRQNIIGTALARQFGNDTLTFEANYLRGDHDNALDKDARSLFLEYDGTVDQTTYYLRAEDHSKHYRPDGAVISGDREAAQLSLTTPVTDGLTGRVQGQTIFQSPGPSETQIDIGDLTVFGEALGFNGRLNGNVRNTDSPSSDRRTLSGRLDLTRPITPVLDWTLDGFARRRVDRVAGTTQSRVREGSFGIDYSMRVTGWRVNANPGVSLRRSTDSNGTQRDVEPQLLVRAANGTDRLTLTYNLLDRDSSREVTTNRSELRYTREASSTSRYGLEVDHFERDDSQSQDSASIRAGAFYEWQFGGTYEYEPDDQNKTRAKTTNRLGGLLLDPLSSGSLDETTNKLGDPYTSTGLAVYEASVIASLSGRQRLAYVTDNNSVTQSALVLGVDESASAIEDAQSRLIDRLTADFGAPDSVVDDGAISGDIAEKLQSGELKRVYQWSIDERTIRAGLVLTPDGSVRLEVHAYPDRRAIPRTNADDWWLFLPR